MQLKTNTRTLQEELPVVKVFQRTQWNTPHLFFYLSYLPWVLFQSTLNSLLPKHKQLIKGNLKDKREQQGIYFLQPPFLFISQPSLTEEETCVHGLLDLILCTHSSGTQRLGQSLLWGPQTQSCFATEFFSEGEDKDVHIRGNTQRRPDCEENVCSGRRQKDLNSPSIDKVKS